MSLSLSQTIPIRTQAKCELINVNPLSVDPFTLYAVLVYFQMTCGLLLYLKLARVVVGNISKKGKNIEGIIA